MPNYIQLQETDKVRVRYHLNYQSVDPQSPIYAGAVMYLQDQFLLEEVMNHVEDLQVPRIQNMLSILDGIEAQMVDALTRLQASKADVVTLNPNEHAQLGQQYFYWQNRLSIIMGMPINRIDLNGSGFTVNVRK